jgi:hypothetical protein
MQDRVHRVSKRYKLVHRIGTIIAVHCDSLCRKAQHSESHCNIGGRNPA